MCSISWKRVGAWCEPPFRQLMESSLVNESYPSFYWVVARFVQPLQLIKPDLSKDLQITLITRAQIGIEMFLRQDILKSFTPRSYEKAQNFLAVLTHFLEMVGSNDPRGSNIDVLQTTLEGFSITLQDELDRIPTFIVTGKGNLDIRALVKGAANGWPKATIELLNEFVLDDVNHAGECLAYDLPTASGFHILRAVETCAKAYVHAATGKLPPIKNRNWGEYIEQLKIAQAHADVTDVLRILKAKRNPLMHPHDNMDVDDAIALLCLCQSGIDAIAGDLQRRSLEVKFKESLALLPTL